MKAVPLKQITHKFRNYIYSNKYSKYLIIILVIIAVCSIGYTFQASYRLFQMNQAISESKAIINDASNMEVPQGGVITSIAGEAIKNTATVAMSNILNKVLKVRNLQILKVIVSTLIAIPSTYLTYIVLIDKKLKRIFKGDSV